MNSFLKPLFMSSYTGDPAVPAGAGPALLGLAALPEKCYHIM